MRTEFTGVLSFILSPQSLLLITGSQRNVAMLFRRIMILLIFQHLERTDEGGAGILGINDSVDVP